MSGCVGSRWIRFGWVMASLLLLAWGDLALAKEILWSGQVPIAGQLRSRIELLLKDPSERARYQEVLEGRRQKLMAVLQASSPDDSPEEISKEKEVQVYDLMLSSLEELPNDRHQAEQALARVIELDWSLTSEGTPIPLAVAWGRLKALVSNWTVRLGLRHAHEAENLLDPQTGSAISRDEIQRGVWTVDGLSRLDPMPQSSFWQRVDPSQVDDAAKFYYSGGTALQRGVVSEFPEGELPTSDFEKVVKSQSTPKFEVRYSGSDGKKRKARLKFVREVHSDPSVSALMAMLGYSGDIVRNYRVFRVYFRKASIEEFRRDFSGYYTPDRLATPVDLDANIVGQGRDERGEYLDLREVLLEYRPKEIIRVGPWAFNELGHERLREVRGLWLFNLWVGNIDTKRFDNNKVALKRTEQGYELHHLQHDSAYAFGGLLAESPDRFYWELVSRLNLGKREQLRFTHISFFDNFLAGEVTEADLRWGTRLIAGLSRRQIEQAVAIGDWTDSVAQLLVEKLCSRRNQLVRALGMERELGQLPVNRRLTTADGVVVNGRLTQSRFDPFVIEFGNYYQRLIAPLGKALKRAGQRLLQVGTATPGFLRMSEVELGFDTGLVSEVLLQADRQVVPNENHRSERDRHLVLDTIRVGFRLGVGVVASGQMTVWRTYRLSYAVPTRADGMGAGNFAVNLLLPFRLWRGTLPKDHVLMIETAIEGSGVLRLGFDAASPVVLDSRLGRRVLSRAVVRDSAEGFEVFSDLEHSWNSQLRLLANLFGMARLSLVTRDADQSGHARGRYWKIPSEILSAETPAALALAGALGTVIRHGSTAALEAFGADAPGASFESRFTRSRLRWNWFGLRSGQTSSERVSSSGSLFDKGHEQIRTAQERRWSLLSAYERHAVRAELLGETESPDRWMRIRWLVEDNDTSTRELQSGYLGMIRDLSRQDRGGVLDLDASVFSRNDRWGHTVTRLELRYGPEAVRRLTEVRPEKFWSALARVAGVTHAELSRARAAAWTQDSSHVGGMRTRTALETLALKARFFALKLWGWGGRKMVDASALVLALNGSFQGARHTIEPRILAALNEAIGAEYFELDAEIAPPENKASVFPGEGALVHVHRGVRAGQTVSRLTPFELFAETPHELHRFFDVFR